MGYKLFLICWQASAAEAPLCQTSAWRDAEWVVPIQAHLPAYKISLQTLIEAAISVTIWVTAPAVSTSHALTSRTWNELQLLHHCHHSDKAHTHAKDHWPALAQGECAGAQPLQYNEISLLEHAGFLPEAK